MRTSWIIRKDEKAVSPVIATILMVAITVVLAAVLYVMVTGLLAGPGATKPQLTFGSAQATTNGFEFVVAGVTLTKAAANFRIAVTAGGTSAGAAQTLAATLTWGTGASTVWVNWTDIGGEGNLNGGDSFRFARSGGLVGATEYVVNFLWADGSSVGSRAYP